MSYVPGKPVRGMKAAVVTGMSYKGNRSPTFGGSGAFKFHKRILAERNADHYGYSEVRSSCGLMHGSPTEALGKLAKVCEEGDCI